MMRLAALVGRWSKTTAGVLISGAMVLTVAACGSSDDSDSGSGSSSGDSATLSAFDSKVDKMMDEWTGEQTALPPTSGPAPTPGLKLMIIPQSMQAPGIAAQANQVQAIAESLGWEAEILDPAGDPVKVGNFLKQAVSQGYDAVATIALDPGSNKADFEALRAANITTAGYGAYDPTGLMDATVPDLQSHFDAGYAAMAALYQQTKGDLKVVLANAPESAVVTDPEIGRLSGAKKFIEECQAAGGSCEEVAQVDILAANYGPPMGNLIVSAIRSNPDANAVWNFASPLNDFIVASFKQAGVSAALSGVDAVESNYNAVRDGSQYEQYLVANPQTWIMCALVDQINRISQGEPAADQNIPAVKIIDESNVPDSGTWDGDTDILALYETLWGVS